MNKVNSIEINENKLILLEFGAVKSNKEAYPLSTL